MWHIAATETLRNPSHRFYCCQQLPFIGVCRHLNQLQITVYCVHIPYHSGVKVMVCDAFQRTAPQHQLA